MTSTMVSLLLLVWLFFIEIIFKQVGIFEPEFLDRIDGFNRLIATRSARCYFFRRKDGVQV